MTDATGDPLARLSPSEKRAMLADLLRERARSARAPYPISVGQQAIWFQQQLAPESPAYNVAYAVRIASRPDVDAIRAAFQAILDRHAVLRCTFRVQDGAPVAETRGYQEVDFERVELGGAALDDVRRRVYRDSLRPFDLESGPLFRVRLYSSSPGEHVLALVVHHTVSDARSVEIVLKEVLELYAARTQGVVFPSPPSGPEYADFVRWQAELLAGPEGARLARFWAEQLQGELPVLDLPYDRPAPPVPTMRGATHETELGTDLPGRLQALAQSARVTPYTLLLSAFQVLLHRYTGQDDVVVGSPTWGRNRAGFGRIVGYCVNPIAVRADLSGDPSFLALLDRNRDRIRDALANQDYPFPLVVERLGVARQPGRHPVFQVMLNFMRRPPPVADAADGLADVAGLRVGPFPIPHQEGQFDLSLEVVQTGNSMAAALRYATDRFDASTAERMAGHYRTVLEGLVAAPETPISRLPLLTAAERRRTLTDWNATARDLEDACVHELIEAQVDRSPGRVAVEAAGVTMTYGELERAANALAHRLRALGVGPESLVGLCTDRSTDLVVGLLGILKAGGAYLPLDPFLPAERLAMMLEDAGVTVLVTQGRLRERVPGDAVRTVCVDADLAHEPTDRPSSGARADGLAYVIYTSGSTGRPKGVEISHRAVVNLLRATQRRLGFAEDDVLLSTTTISFDIAGLELFVPLIGGGRVSVATREVAADGWQLAAALERSRATVMQSTPSGWRLLIDSGWRGQPGLRALSGGEPLDRELARALLGRCAELWNCYGPTETTIWSTFHRVLSAEGPILIGRPLDNTQIYVLDRFGQPVPPGAVGEIHIGGAGLARGYRNRPELTAERFVELRVDDGPARRLYRTGDLGRWRPDGALECLGRTDHQVKLRGHRIEPGEIEAVLLARGDVGEAAVIPVADGGASSGPPYDRLVAFVTPRPSARSDEAEILVDLRRQLPGYMIPAAILVIDALPRLPNGKLDRGSLLRLGAPAERVAGEGTLPVTPTERRIAAIWKDLLGVTSVGVHDNFYDLGGHSLLSIQAISRIQDAVGVRLNPHELTYQTLGQLAAACDRMASAPASRRAGGAQRATTPDAPRYAAPPESGPDAAASVASGDNGLGLHAPPPISPGAITAPAGARGEIRRPFFFGRSGEELFGCLQLPASAATRDTGVVLCHPFGQEYIRAHRLLVQLGTRLTRVGFPVLRFDHFGCGDSAGASDEGSIERWTEDIGVALDVMRDRCGVSALCLIGLRLGGALAAMAATARGDVRSLVLWDPVVRGDEYLNELRAMHRRMLALAYASPSRGESGEEVLGFPLQARLRRGLADVDLHAVAERPAEHVLLLDGGPEKRLTPLAARLGRLPLRLDHRHVSDRQVWLEEPTPGLVPRHALEVIVDWLVEVHP